MVCAETKPAVVIPIANPANSREKRNIKYLLNFQRKDNTTDLAISLSFPKIPLRHAIGTSCYTLRDFFLSSFSFSVTGWKQRPGKIQSRGKNVCERPQLLTKSVV